MNVPQQNQKEDLNTSQHLFFKFIKVYTFEGLDKADSNHKHVKSRFLNGLC